MAPAAKPHLRLAYVATAPPVENTSPPATRADCIDGPRPCPATRCRWHLAADFRTPRTTPGTPSRGADSLSELRESCALDVADRGGATLEEVGEILGVTRERVRQIEAIALGKAERAGIRIGAYDLDMVAERRTPQNVRNGKGGGL